MILFHLLAALVISQRARQLAWIIIRRHHVIEIGSGVISVCVVCYGLYGLSSAVISWLEQPSAPVVAHHEDTPRVKPTIPEPLAPSAETSASTKPRGQLPWDQPLNDIQDALQGPTAATLTLVGFMMSFAVLVFGGELGFLARTLVYTVMVMSILAAGTGLLPALGLAPTSAEPAANSSPSGPTRSTGGCVPIPPIHGCF